MNHTSRRHGRITGLVAREGWVEQPSRASRLAEAAAGLLLLIAWTVGLLVVAPTLAFVVAGR